MKVKASMIPQLLSCVSHNSCPSEFSFGQWQIDEMVDVGVVLCITTDYTIYNSFVKNSLQDEVLKIEKWHSIG